MTKWVDYQSSRPQIRLSQEGRSCRSIRYWRVPVLPPTRVVHGRFKMEKDNSHDLYESQWEMRQFTKDKEEGRESRKTKPTSARRADGIIRITVTRKFT